MNNSKLGQGKIKHEFEHIVVSEINGSVLPIE